MQNTSANPVIAYYGHVRGKARFERELDGIRRFAGFLGWRLEVIPPAGRVKVKWPYPPRVAATLPPLDAAALRARIRALRPVGAIVECSIPENVPPASVFAGIPVAWIDSPDTERRPGAEIRWDNAAVAAAAFRELSATLPPAYAVSPYHFTRRWSDLRVAAFLALCRAAGKPCNVFRQRDSDDIAERRPRRAAW
ncbi:MAG: hypothetical protein IJ783_05580, partial [Kiritimatiellae bacterium]|nr:hypothetical protein [Kiritimatiellia bacterium]